MTKVVVEARASCDLWDIHDVENYYPTLQHYLPLESCFRLSMVAFPL
jgi:hypothetical protein